MRKQPQEQQHAAAKRSRFRGDPLACFDRLPAPLRAKLHEAVVDWCPLHFRSQLNKLVAKGLHEAQATQILVAVVAESDAIEMVEFGRALPRAFGGVSPHLAANATVQRYGARPAFATQGGRLSLERAPREGARL